MSRDLIFAPVIAQVLLTLLVYVILIRAKVRTMKAGEVDTARRALYDDAWPESVMKINNNIRNQFEVPVLFYVLSRIVHAWVHIGSNYMPTRRRVFTVGWFLVLAMALLVAFELGKRALGYGPLP